MPQLPSGRHIALDPAPLDKLIRQAENGALVHQLMAIKSAEDAFSHIGVSYFRQRALGSDEPDMAPDSARQPDDLEPYPSGFNLVTIQHELARWSTEDRVAFLAFLRESRVATFLESLLRAIKSVQADLLDAPSTLPGLLATWWQLGIHPLQEEDDPHNLRPPGESVQ